VLQFSLPKSHPKIYFTQTPSSANATFISQSKLIQARHAELAIQIKCENIFVVMETNGASFLTRAFGLGRSLAVVVVESKSPLLL
jgi:hypothetical protein